jgi:Dihaem cytochrome c
LHRTSTNTSLYRQLITAALWSLVTLLASCQSHKMPDEDSYAAQLYVKRCGQCHQAYNPRLMTAPMWAVKVDLMQERLRQTGLPPLTPDERKTILEYLSSSAGQQ